MADRFNVLDFNPVSVLNNGSGIDRTGLYRGSLVGPASYATGGIPVDLSTIFSVIHDVVVLKSWVTATDAVTAFTFTPQQVAPDLFSAGKFRLFAWSFSTNIITASGALAQVTADDVPANASCSVGCDTNHPHGTTTARTNLLQGAGTAAKVQSAIQSELPAATNLSAASVSYLAIGTLL